MLIGLAGFVCTSLYIIWWAAFWLFSSYVRPFKWDIFYWFLGSLVVTAVFWILQDTLSELEAPPNEPDASVVSDPIEIKSTPSFRLRPAHLLLFLGIASMAYGVYQLFPSKGISVKAVNMWTPTGINVKPGDKLTIESTGKVTASNNQNDAAYRWVEPDGWGYDPQSSWTLTDNGKPTTWTFVLGKGSSLMCLTAKIGNGQPFKVGSKYSSEAEGSGELFLGVNDALLDSNGNRLDDSSSYWRDNDGSFTAIVSVK